MKAKALLEKRAREVNAAIADSHKAILHARAPLARIIREWNREAKKVKRAIAKYNRLAEKHGRELSDYDLPNAKELLDCMLGCLGDEEAKLAVIRGEILSRH